MSSSRPLTTPDQEKIPLESEREVMLRDKLSMFLLSEDSTWVSISLLNMPEISLSKTLKASLSASLMRLSRLPPIIPTALLSRKRMILRRVLRLTDDLKIIYSCILNLIILFFIIYE
jgi:hypothetical protein